MAMLSVKIAGLGAYLPERCVANDELESRLGLKSGWIGRRTGVHERRYVGGETASEMAAAAGTAALAAAGRSVGDLDAIIGASSGPEQLIPCTAALVQRRIGAPEGKSACFDVNATCLGFLLALQTASHLIAGGVYRTVLIFSAERASAHSLNPNEPESYVLFGDAAAAAVVTRAEPNETGRIHLARLETHSSGIERACFPGAGSRHHPNDPATTREMNCFHMDGPGIFRQASRLIGPFFDAFFADLGWDRAADVDLVVPHQASRHALDVLTARLGFRQDQIFENLATRGNCIAASIPLALTEAVAAGRVRRGDRVLLAGTGAGLTLGALALTF